MTSKTLADFSLAYYAGDRKTGSISLIHCRGGAIEIKPIKQAAESGLAKPLKPVLVGLTEDRHVILLDPKSKQLSFHQDFTADAFAAHIYSDPNHQRDWFMNDGDKESGNDTLNCGDQGSSVTVIEQANSEQARWLATICVGRGHHQAAFSYPSALVQQVPEQVYISNLKDGTISVIGNDPSHPQHYLKVVATIDLCEPDKEKQAGDNNAFPHGLAFSKVSGKVYNLNNGYGTIAIIDPHTHVIEDRISIKGFSNLFVSPDGRYLITRGADRKSDPQHVIAKLAVIDVSTQKVVTTLDLPDIYISKYYFNPEGTRLYLTTSAKGSPEQEANLKADVLLAFDITQLPSLPLLAELSIGASGSLDFLTHDGTTQLILSSCSASGQVVVIDGQNHDIVQSIVVGEPMPHSRAWLLPG